MKKYLFLLVAAFLSISSLNASVVIKSDLIALNSETIVHNNAPQANALEKEETIIRNTINKIKTSLKPLAKIKSDTVTITKETVIQTKDSTTDEAGTTEIVETKEIIKELNGKKELVKKEIKEMIMEAQPIEEVKKETGKSETFVVLKTEKGDVKIKLYMEKAPITAGNFLDLAKRKFYNGLTFHRLIAGFMVQGGCPLGNGTGNFVDPETKEPRYIKHESHPELKHDKEGVVAMARTSDPDSASSQFFIDLGPQPFLNAGGADPHGYAVFGQVVEGMDVVHKIMNENVAPYPGSDGTSNPVKITTVEVVE